MRIANEGQGRIVHEIEEGDSQEVVEITRDIVPEWLSMFARKNADYGSDGAKVLGVRGQYADINRKMLKLKRAIWDGESLHFEQPQEICMDLMGHLALTIQMLRALEAKERAAAYGWEEAEEPTKVEADSDHLLMAAEASLKKQIADAYTAGRLSMISGPFENDVAEDFEYSAETAKAMHQEKLAFARRKEAEEEVDRFHQLPMSEQLRRLGINAIQDAAGEDTFRPDYTAVITGPEQLVLKPYDPDEDAGFQETGTDEPQISSDLQKMAERLKVSLPSGVYDIEPDGTIYKAPENADRIPMALVPKADLKYIVSLGAALAEEQEEHDRV